MISIQVAKTYVWPIRLVFIALAFVVADLVLDKIARVMSFLPEAPNIWQELRRFILAF